MIIETIKDNLFNTKDKYIVHGCNAQRVMGSGVAKIVKEVYPGAYELYQNSPMVLGSFSIYESDRHNIINMITQKYYGKDGKRYVSYDAINDGFQGLNNLLLDGTHISIPRIGAGLGGGNWEIIKTIINEVTPKLLIKVYDI